MAENSMHTGEPINPHVHHEREDVDARALTKFGLVMSAIVVVFLFALWGLFHFLANREAELGGALRPSAVVRPAKLPPEPRLQPNPLIDMREFRASEDRILNEYNWIDPDKGIVRIPIERAMDLMVSQGKFPVRAESAKK